MDVSKLIADSLPSLIGSMAGGMFVLFATLLTLREQERSEERREEREIESLQAAIRVEIDVLWKFHMKRIGNLLENLKDGEALEFYYPLTQGYFTVYDNNADKIGKICDDRLRAAIVTCYNKCKKAVDGFKYNNELYRAYTEAAPGQDNLEKMTLTKARLEKLKDYAHVLKEDHFELKGYVEELLRLLKKQ